MVTDCEQRKFHIFSLRIAGSIKSPASTTPVPLHLTKVKSLNKKRLLGTAPLYGELGCGKSRTHGEEHQQALSTIDR